MRYARRLINAGEELLGKILKEVEPPATADDFLVLELERVLSEGDPSPGNDDFRFLIEQGLRLEYDADADLRARVAERLRLARLGGLSGEHRRAVGHLTAALEDMDGSLARIMGFPGYYAARLFERLERAEAPDGAAASLVDTASENAGDGQAVRAAVAELGNLLAAPGVPAAEVGVAVRGLAWLVSEPILEEPHEDLALSFLRASWPAARLYLLYGLRRHAHEDIPHRWIELLVDMDDLRALDRILEEVLIHSRAAAFREDLLVLLDLTGRSRDPGRRGKLLRLLRGPGAPAEARHLIESWLSESPHAAFLHEEAVPARAEFVHLDEDFSRFAAHSGESSLAGTFRRWDLAFHESLGWRRWTDLPRSPFEIRSEALVRESLLGQLSEAPLPEEGLLRALVESTREEMLEAGPEPPLLTIYRNRPRSNRWEDEVWRREVHALYRQAAASYDDGEYEGARRKLGIVLALAPDHPFARSLERVMAKDQKSLHDLK